MNILQVLGSDPAALEQSIRRNPPQFKPTPATTIESNAYGQPSQTRSHFNKKAQKDSLFESSKASTSYNNRTNNLSGLESKQKKAEFRNAQRYR